MSTNEPLGLPRGTVRAILVLILVLSLDIIAIATVLTALQRGSLQFLEQLTLLVVGAVIGATTTAVSWYFANRTTPGE